MTDRNETSEAPTAPIEEPGLLRTYALTYAIGAVWLAVEVLMLGTESKYAFTAAYDAYLTLPPMLTALCLLLVDRFGPLRSVPVRTLILSIVAGVISVISTVVLTPVLALMFREGVGHSLVATAILSAATLAVVTSPLLIEIVAAVRTQRWLHVTVLLAGIAVAAVAFSMALSPTGALAASMRLDQGEILMITSSWWLPVYALAAAFTRRAGLA